MNIFEQEDLIKGLPDERLMKEAQQPTGQMPQYLIVSEIQRRADMRKRFAGEQQKSPDSSIKDQILGGGIAAVAPPQGGMQGAMMGAPQQPPAQPMPPQQAMPAPQQPMPQQPMARGGVIRMFDGQDTPYTGWTPVGNTIDEIAGSLYDHLSEYEQPKRKGNPFQYAPGSFSRGDIAASIFGESSDPLLGHAATSRDKFIEKSRQNNALQKYLPNKGSRIDMMSANQNIEKGTLAPAGKTLADLTGSGQSILADASRISGDLATKLDKNLIEFGSSDVSKDKTDPKVATDPTFADISRELLKAGKSQSGSGEIMDRIDTTTSDYLTRAKSIKDSMEGLEPVDYQSQLSKYNTDFSKYSPDYTGLISEQELRAKKIKEDAKKEVGAQSLIQLGAGILEGDVAAGLRGAGQAASGIMKEARAESTIQQQAADALKVSAQQAEMTLGIAGEEAAINQITENNRIISQQMTDARQQQLAAAGVDLETAKTQANLESTGWQIYHASSSKEKELLIESLIKTATNIRYQNLIEEDKTATQREIIDAMGPSLTVWIENYNNQNETQGDDGRMQAPDLIKFERDFNQYVNTWMKAFGADVVGDRARSSVEGGDLTKSRGKTYEFDKDGFQIN